MEPVTGSHKPSYQEIPVMNYGVSSSGTGRRSVQSVATVICLSVASTLVVLLGVNYIQGGRGMMYRTNRILPPAQVPQLGQTSPMAPAGTSRSMNYPAKTGYSKGDDWYYVEWTGQGINDGTDYTYKGSCPAGKTLKACNCGRIVVDNGYNNWCAVTSGASIFVNVDWAPGDTCLCAYQGVRSCSAGIASIYLRCA